MQTKGTDLLSYISYMYFPLESKQIDQLNIYKFAF